MRGMLRGGLLLAALGVAVPAAAQQQPVVLTVEEALELALRSNRDVVDARLTLESARQRVKEAWADVLPQLDLNATYTRNLTVPSSFLPRVIIDPTAPPDELMPVRFGADNAWRLQLRAEQRIFEAGVFIGVGAADRYRALQAESLRGRAQGVATRVKIAYYDVLLSEQAVTLTQQTVDRIRQSLDETQKMERAGLSSSYDVLRLQVELANVEPNLRRARTSVAAARRSLAIELGLDTLDAVSAAGRLTDFDTTAAPLVRTSAGDVTASASETQVQDALRLALAHRSDLRQVALEAELRRAELKAEWGEYLPKISVFGVYSIDAQHNGDPSFFGRSGAERAYGRQVGVQVTMPLFSGLRRPARIAQREATVAQVRTQQALLRDQVENQVRTLLDEVSETRARTDAQRLAVEQAQRGYQIAAAQYREGLGSQLERTDAEVALRQSEFNYAQAIYDHLVAQARLEEAMGTVPLPELRGTLAMSTEMASK